MEKVKEMLTNEMRAKTANSYSQQILGGQSQQIYESDATAQVREIDVQNCVSEELFINFGLQIGLPDSLGVLVNCQDQGNCVRVRVDAPADKRRSEVRVCDRGKSAPCMILHYTQKCNFEDRELQWGTYNTTNVDFCTLL